jgi:hypothetical protein
MVGVVEIVLVAVGIVAVYSAWIYFLACSMLTSWAKANRYIVVDRQARRFAIGCLTGTVSFFVTLRDLGGRERKAWARIKAGGRQQGFWQSEKVVIDWVT